MPKCEATPELARGHHHNQGDVQNLRDLPASGPAPQVGWGVTLPWLKYVEEASDVRDGTDIEMEVNFASVMDIVLAKYSLNGTWLSMEAMSTQVCSA